MLLQGNWLPFMTNVRTWTTEDFQRLSVKEEEVHMIEAVQSPSGVIHAVQSHYRRVQAYCVNWWGEGPGWTYLEKIDRQDVTCKRCRRILRLRT